MKFKVIKCLYKDFQKYCNKEYELGYVLQSWNFYNKEIVAVFKKI